MIRTKDIFMQIREDDFIKNHILICELKYKHELESSQNVTTASYNNIE